MSEKENINKLNAFFGDEYDRLKSYVHSRISDTADRDAEDIIQDVALNLFSRSSNSPIENVAGFVYHAIRNKIVDIMRTRKPSQSFQDEGELKLREFAELFNENDHAHFSEANRALLIQAISELKPNYKQVIIAIDFEGFSYKELSQQTKVAEGTLMSRRHRALAILNKSLKNKIEF